MEPRRRRGQRVLPVLRYCWLTSSASLTHFAEQVTLNDARHRVLPQSAKVPQAHARPPKTHTALMKPIVKDFMSGLVGCRHFLNSVMQSTDVRVGPSNSGDVNWEA